MLSESEVTIRLNGTSDATITIKKEDRIVNKNVSLDSLVSCLAANYKISTGILPRGTRFFSGSSTNYRIGIEIPRNIRTLRYVKNGVFEYNIPFPVCFVIFSIENNIVFSTEVFSLRNPITSEDDYLYHFPFGNVYKEGKVCWGGVKVPTINSPFELLSLVGLFFNSEYNGDLIGSYSFNSNADMQIEQSFVKTLFDALNNKEVFPNNILRKTEYHIKDFMHKEEN